MNTPLYRVHSFDGLRQNKPYTYISRFNRLRLFVCTEWFTKHVHILPLPFLLFNDSFIQILFGNHPVVLKSSFFQNMRANLFPQCNTIAHFLLFYIWANITRLRTKTILFAYTLYIYVITSASGYYTIIIF